MNKLTQDKYYRVILESPYSVAGQFDIYVSAIAKKATLNLYGDFDIRGTFFTAAGVGIRRYLELVTDDTDIYICHPIKSEEPIEIDDGNFIFIPVSIINFNKTEEFTTATRFTFNIEGVRRRFDSDIDRQNFIDDVEESISHACNKETSLGNDVLSISEEQSDHLVLESIIKVEEENRLDFITERENAVTKQAQDESAREMDYYKRIKDLELREKQYQSNIANVNTLIKQAETSKNIGAKFLLNVNDLMTKIKDLYAQFTKYANTYNYAIPEWDNLFRLVYKSADGRGGSGISTDEWLEMMVMIAQGDIPEDLTDVELSHCPLCGTDVDKILEQEAQIETE